MHYLGNAWWYIHTFNPSTWEAEAGGLLLLRPTWFPQWIPSHSGLQCKTVSLKKKWSWQDSSVGRNAKPEQPKFNSRYTCTQWTVSATTIIAAVVIIIPQVYMSFLKKKWQKNNRIEMFKYKVSLYPELTQTLRPNKRTASEKRVKL